MSKNKKTETNKKSKTSTKSQEKTRKTEVEVIKFEPLPGASQKDSEKKSSNQKKGKKKLEVNDVPKPVSNINDKIQSIVSILFTIVIFLAFLILIFVLYNNYLKPKKEQDLQEVCKDLLPKDYHITSEMIDNFIKNARAIIYNFDNFDIKQMTLEEQEKLAMYFIWGANDDYIVCTEEEEKCLVSKMEMPYQKLQEYFLNYFDIKNLNLQLKENFQDDDQIRLYREDDKIVLSFSEFFYQSLRHNLVYSNVEEDKVTLVFALERLVENTNIYQYAGSKTIQLKYKNHNLIIQSIKTDLN